MFERGRWSLFVEFDPYEETMHDDWFESGLGEKAEFEAYVLRQFGGLPEEIHEILLHHEDGRIEVSGDTTTVDWLCQLMGWICSQTSPREMKLVRNEDRYVI